MDRDELIRNAIKNLPGDEFEKFAVALLMRELYPGLNPTSRSHDGGEDAITNSSVTFMNGGKYISVAASKTGTLAKIRLDCKACKKNGSTRDILVFATDEDIQTDTEEKWRREIKQDFNWDLELRTPRWMVPVLCKPEYESFVDDHLDVPPTDGDCSQTIYKEFSKVSDIELKRVRLRIPGLDSPIERPEVEIIEDQLALGKSVVLIGDAGIGKSGIGYFLVQKAINAGKSVLFFDARRFASIKSEGELSICFHLKGSLTNAIIRAGKHRKCRLVIDQFDNISGTDISNVIIEIICNLQNCVGVEIVVISRKREPHEALSLSYLIDRGFIEKACFPITTDKVRDVFEKIGVANYTSELLKLGSNLLNLELIGRIREERPDFQFTKLLSEIDLWEKYIAIVHEREVWKVNSDQADRLIHEAKRLARLGLKSPDRDFDLEILTGIQQRLASWEIIIKIEGYKYRFRHEKLQDFLYAKDAVDRGFMTRDVLSDIPKYRTRNIFPWMQNIYLRNHSNKSFRFLKELLNV